jgi:hypothetical protein
VTDKYEQPTVTVPEGQVLARRIDDNVILPAEDAEIWVGEYWHVKPEEITPLHGWELVGDDEREKLVASGKVVIEGKKAAMRAALKSVPEPMTDVARNEPPPEENGPPPEEAQG